MKRVGAPVASPDGKWAVFSVTDPAYDEKDQGSDLWIAPADGSSPPRRLTFTKGSESGVAWSPDSRRIAFSARREGDEAAQIYLLDVAGGGEAQRATTLTAGASSAVFSPDGRSILFSSSVYPACADEDCNKKTAAERKARKYNARVYEGFPIRYWDHWLDDRQAHLFVQSLEPSSNARDLLAGTKLAAQPGFGAPLGTSGDELRGVWSPDGRSVLFAVTANRNRAAYAPTNMDLFQVPASGGEPKQLTSGGDSFTQPVFAPDGKSVFALHEQKGPSVYYLTRIVRFPWPSMATRTVVTADLDRSVNSFVVTPDSRGIYLLAEEHGHEKLFTVPAAGGAPRLAFDLTSGVYTGLALAGSALIANWESAVNPAEVVRIDPATGHQQNLSNFNTVKAAGIDLPPAREFWFTSKRGKKIHSLLIPPPGFDESKKYPLFVLIHGGAANMWRDQFFLRWNYHLIASPGYVLLLTNYTGSTGFGEKFAQEIQGDPLKGPGDEINEAADEAIRKFAFIDGSRQAAGGASYGGHLTNWLQATTTRYNCLVAHAGLVNLESQWGTSDGIYHREVANGGPVWEQGKVWKEQNPIRYAANFRTPILVTVGERDFRVPMNQTLENWSALQRMQVPSKLIVFPDENHWILKGEDSRFFYQELHAWLKKYL